MTTRLRFTRVVFVALAGSLAIASAAEGREPKIRVERDIVYGKAGRVELRLNIASPAKGNGPFPAVVCIHGGGFRAGKRESYDGLCVKLAERGYVAATMTYRLAPQHKFPAAVHDTKAAVRWLRGKAATYKINPDKIGVTGGSAGGHLAQANPASWRSCWRQIVAVVSRCFAPNLRPARN